MPVFKIKLKENGKQKSVKVKAKDQASAEKAVREGKHNG